MFMCVCVGVCMREENAKRETQKGRIQKKQGQTKNKNFRATFCARVYVCV